MHSLRANLKSCQASEDGKPILWIARPFLYCNLYWISDITVVPRGCKLGLGPHSAGSCTGKSDHTGSALGSLQFCKPAAQM